MSEHVSRRGFLKGSAIATTAAALGLSFEEKALVAQATGQQPAQPPPETSTGSLPTGKIGKLTVTRLICGGNLISSFAHSRDLIYVSPLLKQYFTDDKVLETLEICESKGINTVILRVDSQTLRIISRYWKERGGKLQWIAQVKPTEEDPEPDINKAVDTGAVGVYVHGGDGDTFVEKGKVDLLGKALEVGRRRGVLSGLAGHKIETIMAIEKAGLQPDFYMKTLNAKNYWSAKIEERNDSVWEETPEETIKFMRGVNRPWIAYKVLGAGAIHPREGFQYAYENGADFICVGMFDFQVVEDIVIAKNILSKLGERKRPWRG